MATDKMDSSAVYALFEEIKQELKEKSQSKGQSTVNIPELSDIKDCVNQSNEQFLSKFEDIAKGIAQPVTQKINHHVSIDIKSSWVFLTIIGLSLFLIASLVLSYKLKQANDLLSDNDLKYRYINMQGKANQETLLKLETYFTYNQNKDSISTIRKRVETYERLVKEQAEKIERARLNAKEAEQLQKEVESVKGR